MRDNGRQKSLEQERKLALDLGGRVQPASGARDGWKGDVRAQGKVRAEAKTTGKDSYRLYVADLLKIQKEANTTLEDWVFQIELRNEHHTTETKLAVVSGKRFGNTAVLETNAVPAPNSFQVWYDIPVPYLLHFARSETHLRFLILGWGDYLERVEREERAPRDSSLP
jgi:hypothetical protein